MLLSTRLDKGAQNRDVGYLDGRITKRSLYLFPIDYWHTMRLFASASARRPGRIFTSNRG